MMWRGSHRSRLAHRKTMQTARIPAGDPADSEECTCANYILTENSQPILTENVNGLTPEG